MTRIYHRAENGTLEVEAYSGSKEDYLEALNVGIPAEFGAAKTGEEDLMGWPDSRVEWYGNVGFPVA